MPRAPSRLRRIVLLAGVLSVGLFVTVVAVLASRSIAAQVEQSVSDRLLGDARRAAAIVNQYLDERREDLRFLAQTPGVVAAAAAAGRAVSARGLDRMSIDAVEAALDARRAVGGDPAVADLLDSFREHTDFAEIFFTESTGITVLGTNRTTDAVQRDEEWWQEAMATGEFQGRARFDESAGVIALEYAVQIFDLEASEPSGVMKGAVALSGLGRLLATTGDTLVRVEVVGPDGRVMGSADPQRLLTVSGTLPLGEDARVVGYDPPGGAPLLAAVVPTDNGRAWTVAVEPRERGAAAAAAVRRTVLIVAAILMAVTLAGLVAMTHWLDRQVTEPVITAGAAANRIAEGDLSVQIAAATAGAGEVGDLLGAVDRMVQALRHLVTAIRTSAEDSSAMAEEISASTEELSASAAQMATTCQYLTERASIQAGLVRDTAADANKILSIAERLAQGTTDAVERNAALKAVAEQHRDRLLQGREQIAALTREVELGVAEAQSLATMSGEIEAFVRQSREIAAQTKMLSLNAAIEAARSEGGDGRGFGVVADEVRKLAGQAARAASVTADTVRRALATVETTQTRLNRIAEGSASVREVAESAARGLEEVAGTAGRYAAWTDDISQAAGQARELVAEITARLRALSEGTDALLPAVEEIAAAAQEQTASAEEIAASAGHLAEAAEGLTARVSTFRLLPPPPPVDGSPPGAAPAT